MKEKIFAVPRHTFFPSRENYPNPKERLRVSLDQTRHGVLVNSVWARPGLQLGGGQKKFRGGVHRVNICTSSGVKRDTQHMLRPRQG